MDHSKTVNPTCPVRRNCWFLKHCEDHNHPRTLGDWIFPTNPMSATHPAERRGTSSRWCSVAKCLVSLQIFNTGEPVEENLNSETLLGQRTITGPNSGVKVYTLPWNCKLQAPHQVSSTPWSSLQVDLDASMALQITLQPGENCPDPSGEQMTWNPDGRTSAHLEEGKTTKIGERSVAQMRTRASTGRPAHRPRFAPMR